tara:strand:+ start:38 stop:424 length:387 start_codon:yes stop_codon:yes gene_type:complete
MKDFVIRLASMKLAELKFDVQVGVKIGNHPTAPIDIPSLSLKEIKKYLSNTWGVSKDSFDNFKIRKGYSQLSFFYIIVELKQVGDNKVDLFLSLYVNRPENMEDRVFESIMNASFPTTARIEKIMGIG